MKTSKVLWSIERLEKMYRKNTLHFDLTIQRKDNIWDNLRKSKLIHSLLIGYPIPALYAFSYKEKSKRLYQFLDGKQRLTSIFAYLCNRFPLHHETPEVNEMVVEGLFFADLPEEYRSKITSTLIDIVKVEEVTEKDLEEIYYRLNSGVTLKPIEITRTLLGSKNLKYIKDICATPFFAEKIKLSSAARQRYADEELVLQILELIEDMHTGFSSKEIESYARTIVEQPISEETKTKMQNACYFLNEAFPKKVSFLKKLHVPILFKQVLDIQENAFLISPEEFAHWANKFFENGKIPEDYMKASVQGSARKENVQKRLSIMTHAFRTYFGLPFLVSNAEDIQQVVNNLNSSDKIEDGKEIFVG